eukprot:TRINITY_DN766_c0_g1_i3.p1 TRINITY_DN766_c0_g1~~TRINITY_DN766_c0_g1_i3.p1  ORF type:complete len:201 (+),score=37.56 TRINITY_DN766_c0_g1_i3:28-603(+)
MIQLPPASTYKLFGHGPTVLVATNDETKHSKVTLMTCGWQTPLEFDVLGVVLGQQSHTGDLLRQRHARGEKALFSVSAPAAQYKDEVALIGSTSGKDLDKLEDARVKGKIQVVKGLQLTGCIACALCELIDIYPVKGGDSTMIVGKVQSVEVRADVWDAASRNVRFPPGATPDMLTIHSPGGESYVAPVDV